MTMEPTNAPPRIKAHAVELFGVGGQLLGNAVWYGTPQMRIPIFATGRAMVVSIDGNDQELDEAQQLEVTNPSIITFDFTVKPSADEVMKAARKVHAIETTDEETDPPSA